MLTDAELLRRYALDRDERAFAELVQRHLGVVYGAALRRTGGRTHLAEEIAQKIFTDLARKAAVLSSHPALTGWLHRSTRYAAIDAARAERRGQKLSESLAAMADTNPPLEAQVEWSHLRPVLDEVLDELKESDREAMLLRYFEGLSFAEVGERLRLSENAARMRTERALEKLRAHLGRRGHHVDWLRARDGARQSGAGFGSGGSGDGGNVQLDPDARALAEAFYAGLPEDARAQWKSIDEMVATFMALGAQVSPFPSADVLDAAVMEPQGEDRMLLRLHGTHKDRLAFRRSADGNWSYAMDAAMMERCLSMVREIPVRGR